MIKIPQIFLFLFLLFNISFGQNNETLNNKFRLAQSFEKSGNIDKAEEIYRELLNIQPWNNQYLQTLNQLYLGQKNYKASINLLESRIRSSPDDISLFGMLGSTYYISGNSKEAFKIWDTAVQNNSNNVISYKVISNYAIENRAFDKAIEFLQQGKGKINDPKVFSYDLANIYSITMKFSSAAEEYCELVKFYPEQLPNIKRRITKYFDTEDASIQTIAVVKQFAEEDGSDVFWELLSYLYIQVKDFPNALQVTIELDKRKKDNGSTLYAFAQNVFKENEFGISSTAYQMLLDRYPNSVFEAKAKIGYAHSLKAAQDRKNFNANFNWLPIKTIDTSGTNEYLPIIKTFQDIVNTYPNSETSDAAQFEIGLMFLEKFGDINSTDSIFKILSNRSILSKTRPAANEQLGKIRIVEGNLEAAGDFYQKIINNSRASKDFKIRAKFMLAKLAFWKFDFSESVNILNDILKDLSHDFANDALELSTLLNSLKSDSVNLSIYAKADLLSMQNKFIESADRYKLLSENQNLFLLSDLAKYKFAEIQLAMNNLPLAIESLKNLTEIELKTMFSDKALFLLGNTYLYGIADKENARKTFEKLLELFPNSLYFDKSRQIINVITNNENKNI
jgi:tetratricopeptide (TPR) repeat protein